MNKFIVLFLVALNIGLIFPAGINGRYTQQDSLSAGLHKMILRLKAGDKKNAFKWFKAHYYELHKRKMLSDSILLRLAEKYPARQTADSGHVKIKASLQKLIKNEIKRITNEMGEKRNGKIPDAFVEEIEKYIILYRDNAKFHSFFNRALRRSRKYVPALKKYFIDKGFPEEILYFVIIESGFNPNAISPAGAAGMFQFMPGTAKEYGLEVNSSRDERFFILKSGAAAAEYLKDLYLELGSINLALASYNSGPSKTRRALRALTDVTDRSFWAIHQKSDVLKTETRNYVPQIYAAIIMARSQNSEYFGFDTISFPKDSIYEMVRLPSAKEIKKLLIKTSLTKQEILKLNPDIEDSGQIESLDMQDYPLFVPRSLKNDIMDVVPVVSKSFNVSVSPKKKVSKNKKKKPLFSYDKKSVLQSRVIEKGDTLIYLVKRGNTLHMVARLFGVAEKDIIKWNHLRFRSLRKGQRLIIRMPDSVKRIVYKIPEKISYNRLGKQFLQPAGKLRQLNRFKSAWLAKDDTVFIYLPVK